MENIVPSSSEPVLNVKPSFFSRFMQELSRLLRKPSFILGGLFVVISIVAIGVVVVISHQKQNAHPSEAAGVNSMLLGTTYTHYSVGTCNPSDPTANVNNTGIITSYNKTAANGQSVRSIVQGQLAAMKANGIQELRLVLWYMTDPGPNTWGPVPSAGGVLSEPYRTNFINYLTDVKNAGFTHFVLTPGPQWTNNPSSAGLDGHCLDSWPEPASKANDGCFDPAKTAENWSFTQDVRALVRQYGPADSRFDIVSEMSGFDVSPNNATNPAFLYQTMLDGYVSSFWAKYVKAYGNADVIASYIASTSMAPTGVDSVLSHRFKHLITDIKNADISNGGDGGGAFPAAFDAHIYPSQAEMSTLTGNNGVFIALYDAYTTLHSSNPPLSKPLIIGETFYNNSDVAAGIRLFQSIVPQQSIIELREWPISVSGFNAGCQISENPPYSISNYAGFGTAANPTPSPSPVLTPSPTPAGGSFTGSLQLTLPQVIAQRQNTPYTATINMQWNDPQQRTGYRYAMCVSVNNGTPVMIAWKGDSSNSYSQSISWYYPNASYVFTLVQSPSSQGGNYCNGTVLATAANR